MSNLYRKIRIAIETKPAMGEPCNHCGWCCLTEVCAVGESYGASQVLPCQFLTDDYRCRLVVDNPELLDEIIGIGTGCDAMTQAEKIAQVMQS